MGIPVPFLELDLPPAESWFVASLLQKGLPGDLMGCPDRAGGHRIAWILDGLDEPTRAEVAALFAQRYTEVTTVAVEGGRWVGTGRILDEHVASPAIHAYIDVEDRFEAPWIHVEADARLRLLPRTDLDLLVDQASLERALRKRGATQKPRIRSFHLARYEALRATLRGAVLDEACRPAPG